MEELEKMGKWRKECLYPRAKLQWISECNGFIYSSCLFFFSLATHADQNKKYIIGFKCYHFETRKKKRKKRQAVFQFGLWNYFEWTRIFYSNLRKPSKPDKASISVSISQMAACTQILCKSIWQHYIPFSPLIQIFSFHLHPKRRNKF